MIEHEGLNHLAVLIAWLINCAVGAYWYSPAGFGKLWAKLSGVDHLAMPENEATKTLGFIILSAAVQAAALALILNSLNVTEMLNGLLVGVVLWAGFVAATTVGNTLYQRLSWKFWWLNASYFLVVMLINSVLLTIWR